uniref:Uncharacterized protein n=1 Tax=Rhizophora mucronata TaxID=61149 RepID=A0A2P2IVS1_RHIMU
MGFKEISNKFMKLRFRDVSSLIKSFKFRI